MTVYMLTFIIFITGWAPLALVFSWQLRRTEAEIARQCRLIGYQAQAIAALRDDLTDLRGEYLAQARTVDKHDDRLSALEDEQWPPYTITYDQTDTGLIQATLHDGDRSFYGDAGKTEDDALTLLAKRLRLYRAFDPRKFPTDLKSRYLLT